MGDVEEFTDFPIEFYNETEELSAQLQNEAEPRIRRLAKGHHDIVGALVKVIPATQKRENSYEATVTLYMRPEYISATEKGAIPLSTLKQALEQVERQAREQREKLRRY
jgi:ribosome-associated translation inhibitor RaiA